MSANESLAPEAGEVRVGGSHSQSTQARRQYKSPNGRRLNDRLEPDDNERRVDTHTEAPLRTGRQMSEWRSPLVENPPRRESPLNQLKPTSCQPAAAWASAWSSGPRLAGSDSRFQPAERFVASDSSRIKSQRARRAAHNWVNWLKNWST